MAFCEFMYEGRVIGNTGYVYRCNKDNKICRAAHLPGIGDLFLGRIGDLDSAQLSQCNTRQISLELSRFSEETSQSSLALQVEVLQLQRYRSQL